MKNKVIVFTISIFLSMLGSKNDQQSISELSLVKYDEKNILELIKHYLPDDPIIIEAGAHFGEDTKLMSKKWPKGTIHAFEPLPTSYEQLQRESQGLLNVKTYPLALSNTTGKANFYIGINDSEGASSLLKPNPILNSYISFAPDPIEVNCITLDEWATENNITKVDFMWLDLEGAELQVLKGSSIIISKVQAIYTEVNFQEFREGNCLYHELKQWLEEQGFQEKWNHLNSSWQGNVLFVKDNPLKRNDR